jgi:hypothetical protein
MVDDNRTAILSPHQAFNAAVTDEPLLHLAIIENFRKFFFEFVDSPEAHGLHSHSDEYRLILNG